MTMPMLAGASRLRPPAEFNGYLWWDFTKRHSLPPGFTYTRGSEKRQLNPFTGKYEAYGANTYAPDYDPLTGLCRGFRSETAATNLLLWSADFSNVTWNLSGSSKAPANSMISGGIAQKLVSTLSYSAFEQTVGTYSGSPETTYAIVESGSGLTNVRLRAYNLTDAIAVCEMRMEFSTGAVTLAAGAGTGIAFPLRAVGPNGGKVYLLAITYTGTSGKARRIAVMNGGTVNVGDLYVHHAQLVSGTSVSSPIVTGAATAARQADVMSMLTLPAWFDQTKYVMFAEVELEQAVAADGRILTLSDGTSANRDMLYATGSAQFNRLVTVASVTNASTSAAGNATGITRMASSLTTNQARHAVKGTATIEDSSVSMPAVSQVHVGHFTSVLQLDGWIRRIGIAPRTMTTAELQALTA